MNTYTYNFVRGLALTLVVLGGLAWVSYAVPVRAEDAVVPPPTTDTVTPPVDTSTPPATTPTATPTSGDTGPAQVTTGNAASASDTTTQANANNATVPSTASSTISDTNAATVVVNASSTADTGSNNASSTPTSGGSVGASVNTGNAIATNNVINVVNTNLVNSTGLIAFLSQIFGTSYDLRNFDWSFFLGGSSASSTCSFQSCGNGSLNVTNSNDATITNTVISRASTGGNSANGGDASITTGDAYASANVVNLANTNIINSHYLLVALNNFGNMSGDITLPGADFFTQLLQGSLGGLGANTTISNTNAATIQSTTTANANTGGNTASSTSGDATVTTGNAGSSANTINQVNSNQIGGRTVYILVNVIGNWTGGIQGLPPGMKWTQTPTGVAIMGDGSVSGTNTSPLNTLNVANHNTATINNDVQVYALTGSNYASSATGTAAVSTGNAYASANVVNIVNTNIIGQNWLLAVFNIFGNWSGNLSFGHPDLWIGGVAQTSNPTVPGSNVVYHFTVANHGDADATSVVLDSKFTKKYMWFDVHDSNPDTGATWNLGTIKKGETKEFMYTATTENISEGVTVTEPLVATVTSQETDNNMADNTETLSIIIGSLTPPTIGGAIGAGAYTTDPKITVEKVVSKTSASLPVTLKYSVKVTNNGGDAYMTKLTDTLTGPDGNELYTRSWDVGTLSAAEGNEVTLTYDVVYNKNIKPGVYHNVARLTGRRGNSVDLYATDMKPVETSADVELSPGGEVLGAYDDFGSCSKIILGYVIKNRSTNNPGDVRALQMFLNNAESEHLDVNGTYDEATIAAVERLQKKYPGDALSPWGLSSATGNVYYTTQHLVNELNCRGSASPLSPEQVKEIAGFRGGVHHVLHIFSNNSGTTTATGVQGTGIDLKTLKNTKKSDTSVNFNAPLQLIPPAVHDQFLDLFSGLFKAFAPSVSALELH